MRPSASPQDPLRYLLTFDVPPAVLSTQSGLVASGDDLAYVGGYAEALASDTFYEFSGNEDLTTGSVGSPAPSAVTIPLPFARESPCVNWHRALRTAPVPPVRR